MTLELRPITSDCSRTSTEPDRPTKRLTTPNEHAGGIAPTTPPASSSGYLELRLTQCLERRPHVVHQKLGLLPRPEVPALRGLVVVHELRVRPLGPTPRR